MPLRLAILGDSPCHLCTAACCKQNGHAYAALLQADEIPRFRPFATTALFRDSSGGGGGAVSTEYVLPYLNGRCQFLGDDNLCTIYDSRPQSCRTFQCISHFNAHGQSRHGLFLQRNPAVLALLESL